MRRKPLATAHSSGTLQADLRTRQLQMNAPRLRWKSLNLQQFRDEKLLQRAREAGIAVLVTPLPDLRELENLAPQVRKQRLTLGVQLPARAIATSLLAQLNALGPLLVVLTPEQTDDLQMWPQVRQILAKGRWPLLRFAAPTVPLCHRLPFAEDVALAHPPHKPLPPLCQTCGVHQQCPGPLENQQVQPLPMPISNQFDLVASAQSGNSIAVQLPEGLTHFTLLRTRDAIVETTLQRGQLYLDRSQKARLDDFSHDLALLQPLADGTWQIAEQQPFAQEEAALLGVLRQLNGVVIDVGAGPVRYVQELAAAQKAGTLQYVAVEPDLPALEKSLAALPDALGVQGTGEHLPLADQSADAVLMLRSFNHLHDVPQALREVARVLKPGGTFLACDNVTFGLCRTQEQLDRAHAIPTTETPFEHFRNADAPEAAEALAQAVPQQFQVKTLQQVQAGASNQWLLVAEKR